MQQVIKMLSFSKLGIYVICLNFKQMRIFLKLDLTRVAQFAFSKSKKKNYSQQNKSILNS